MTLGIFDISVVDLCLIGALLLTFVYEVYFYLRYIRLRSTDRFGDGTQTASQTAENAPGVSVIICAHNESYNLKAYIQSLLTQDYPTFEVIVVNDGSEDSTQAVIESYAILDSRVRTTFVPNGARVKSTKKLALTLAAKAAKYDYLLLTDADCRPETIHWISAMMAGFKRNEHTEIVLGYGAYFAEPTMLNAVIQYDTLFNGLHYMGAAATGKPYMGVGRNLAYRKDTFFTHGGFSDLMKTCAGDDDLFVNKVATRSNVTVVNTPDSITWSVPEQRWKDWWQQKRRHLSVSSEYTARSRRHLAKEPFVRGLFYALEIAIFVLCSPLALCVAYGLLLLRMVMQLVVLNRAAKRLGQPAMGLEIVCFDIMLPLVTLAALSGKKKVKW